MTAAIRNGPEVHRLTESAQRRRRLVFIRAGADSSLALRLAAAGRSFDIVLSLYESSPAQAALAAADVAIFAGGLSKFHAALQIDRRYALFRHYDHALFLDADLLIGAAAVETLFSLAERHGLDLCQASLTADSYTRYRFAHHDRRAQRPRSSNFVEVMAPCFSRAALARCAETFDRTISTWGLDYLWPPLLGFRGIAIVDAVQMRHIDHPDTEAGPFYRYLKSIGVDARQEFEHVCASSVSPLYQPGLTGPLLGWRGPYVRLIPKLIKRWFRARKARWAQPRGESGRS